MSLRAVYDYFIITSTVHTTVVVGLYRALCALWITQVVIAKSGADRDDCRSSLFIRLREIEDMRRPFCNVCVRVYPPKQFMKMAVQHSVVIVNAPQVSRNSEVKSRS